MMAAKEGSKVMTEAGSSQGGQTGGGGGNATPKPGHRGANSADGLMKENASATPRPFGLLMAPPVGGGDHGGLVERPAHPKPPSGVSAAPMPRHSVLLDVDRLLEGDGNWDDGNVQVEMGFRQGAKAQIGRIVDMEDDVYLEFDEEEVVKEEPSETKTWSLLARYSEKGKNYYMITLFSKGDYDFVMRAGPWIFNQNALIVKDLDDDAQPSETVLDTVLHAVPVWVRIYDVPWGKHDDVWGKRYGKGLGEALEVDVPLTTGVKGKPREVKVFKLKYERVPYYCSHCGFMGHKKDECEKKRLGVPSLDYDAHELRCSPYKKFEHRSHFVPPAGQASAKRGLSFASFVDNEMPPLIDDPLPDTAPERADIHDSQVGKAAPSIKEVESALAAKVDAMVMDPSQNVQMQANLKGNDASMPIIQFPDEEVLGTNSAYVVST
ncbi:hypothetical protein ACQ4PT_006804 [Festuca glaucescens]